MQDNSSYYKYIKNTASLIDLKIMSDLKLMVESNLIDHEIVLTKN